jgi:23S rRNA (uracil1939-C5)-methyltransferase
MSLESFGASRNAQIHLQAGGPQTLRALHDGNPALSYRIDAAEVTIEFGPLDFVQVNRSINQAMVAAALAELAPPAQGVVLDLFCGLGNFTLPLSRAAGRVVGVEADAGLIAKARDNAARNGIDRVEFHSDNLFDPQSWGPWAGGRYDRVLLDPPRAGAREVMLQIGRWHPDRVVYISCHPGSLARDAGILVHSQGYKLVAAGVMDMFPHTTHVESIAVFERSR